MVYLILGQGFEEAEAVIPCDLLRRAGIEVRLVGIGGTAITGGHGITLHADCAAEQTDFSDAELLVLPGGMGGVASILGSKTVLDAVSAQYRRGKPVAAICAAPTILARPCARREPARHLQPHLRPGGLQLGRRRLSPSAGEAQAARQPDEHL